MAIDINKLASIRVGLASPEKILSWSHGEVTKSETVNYRTQKPEMDGLFCEKIFGPTKDYTCYCGRYTKAKKEQKTCEKCGVELTTKSVRRERMGHINLATPVSHIWYLKNSPNRMALLLGVSPKDLEDVVYFVSNICIDPGKCDKLRKAEILSELKAKDKFTAIINGLVKNKNWAQELDNFKFFEYKYLYDLSRVQREGYRVLTTSNKQFDYDFYKAKLTEEKEYYYSFFNESELSEAAPVIAEELQELNDRIMVFETWYYESKQKGSYLTDDEFHDRLFEGLNKIRDTYYDIVDGLPESGKDAKEAFTILWDLKEYKKGSVFEFQRYASFIGKHTEARFDSGAGALKVLLEGIDLDKEIAEIKAKLADKDVKKGDQAELLKRLDVFETFKQSGNRPEWMILSVLPVIPPDLRPMIPLDGGRFTSSDVTELYRRVLYRNEGLKKQIAAGSPDNIVINGKRMLQDAVDNLIDNGRRGKAVTGPGNRPLKSLTSSLKGKQGRFRQNLLGKRVDYSGRSVIAVGPELRMYQCGIPREMAVQLFKPFIEAKLLKEGRCVSHKAANKMIDRQDPIVLDTLDEIIVDHPVLLNRAPTLHRLGIQAFEVKLVDGRAIRLHPLVCPPFNADFDGDQMAVHVPLSKEAVNEARTLMLASGNILGPKNGKPITVLTQDMLLGNYFITLEWTKQDFYNKAAKYRAEGDEISARTYELYGDCEGKVFGTFDDVKLALDTKQIHLQTRIAVLPSVTGKTCFTEAQNNSLLITSVGKIIFNSAFPNDFPYINSAKDKFTETNDAYFVPKGTNVKEFIAAQPLTKPIGKKEIPDLIDLVFHRYGAKRTSEFLDDIKDQGFYYSTLSGVTCSIDDIKLLSTRDDIVAEGKAEVEEVKRYFRKGIISESERHKMIIDVWTRKKDEIAKALSEELSKDNRNPFFMMSDSGARGSISNFAQVAGFRGLMSKPSKPSQKDIGKDLVAKLSQTGGKLTASELSKLSQMSAPTEETIEIPVLSSLREGLNVSEYFIATHGTRKGMSDTAIKTSQSGYLTRRLVDVSHDIFVKEKDCHTDEGYEVREIVDTKKNAIIVEFKERIVGRYPLYNVYSTDKAHELLCDTDTLITSEIADKIIARVDNVKKDGIKIRSLFGCRTLNGVCQKCYGLNLATGKLVSIGETVGVMAAQSIGEPGTQLTMRTFHTGGAAGESDITTGLPRVVDLFEAHLPKSPAIIAEIAGQVSEIIDNNNIGEKSIVKVSNSLETREYHIPFGATLRVKKGDNILNGQKITEGEINVKELLEVSSRVDVERYIIKEIQKVYKGATSVVSDKHLEIMLNKMFRKVVILDPGDTRFIPGEKVEINEFTAANKDILLRHGHPAIGKQSILGITKAALSSPSFLSAASFQQTPHILTSAAIAGASDTLQGLKENVLVGKLIPCCETIENENKQEEA